MDFGYFGKVFGIRMVTFCGVRKLKKINLIDISFIFGFEGVFCILWKDLWNQNGHILGGQKAEEN